MADKKIKTAMPDVTDCTDVAQVPVKLHNTSHKIVKEQSRLAGRDVRLARIKDLHEPTGRSEHDGKCKEKELTEWDHVEMSLYGTSATLRTVKSTAPKGDCFMKQRIRKMPLPEVEEMHRANALIDEVDRFFKPTIKPEQLKVSLEVEEEEDEVGSKQGR